MIRIQTRLSPTLIFTVVLVVTVAVLSLRAWRPAGAGETTTTLNELQKRALDIALEMNKLVISLSTLIFGAVGTVVLFSRDQRLLRSRLDVTFIVLALIFPAVAIYFSYLSYDALVEMLIRSFFKLDSPLVLRPRTAQVYSLMAAVVCLGFLVIRTMQPEPDEDDDDPQIP